MDTKKLIKLMVQNKKKLTVKEFCDKHNYKEVNIRSFMTAHKIKTDTFFNTNRRVANYDVKIVNAFMETGNFEETVKLMKERYNYVLKQPEFEKVEKEYLL